MGRYHRLSAADARAFLASKGIARRGPHKLTKHICHWKYCARCGLVALNNEPTRRALRKECITYE